MAEQGDKKAERELRQVLGRLSKGEAEKLVLAVERDRLAGGAMPHGFILENLRPVLREPGDGNTRRGAPTPVRHLCQPFEDLLINERVGGKHLGRICRTTIMPVWEWLEKDLLPDTLPALSQRIVEHTLARKADDLAAAADVLRATCATAMQAALKDAKPGTKEFQAIANRLGGKDAVEDAREMAILLRVAPQIAHFKHVFQGHEKELDARLAHEVRSQFDAFSKDEPDAAPYVAVIAMHRIEKPWQIFRIVKEVARTNTDTLISRTDISVVGELLLHDLEAAVAQLRQIDPAYDPGTVLEKLKLFTNVSRGITDEIGIRRDGAWATRLIKARSEISEIVRERVERVPGFIAKALPMRAVGRFGRGGPRRPDLSRPLDPAFFERALNTLYFLHHAYPYTEATSSKGAVKAATAEIDQYLLEYERAIVEEIRDGDAAIHDRGQAFLDAVADLIETMRGEEEAALLRRRGVTAKKAANA